MPHAQGRPVFTPSDRWSQITLVHHPAHMSSYLPRGCPCPIRPKYMAGPMTSRLKVRFIPHIGNREPFGTVITALTYLVFLSAGFTSWVGAS